MTGRILVVDDVATNRIVMKVKLAAAGYRPVAVPDARGALDEIAREMPDLVLTGLNLPDIDGLALIAGLRADPATAALPLVVVTGPAPSSVRLAAFRAGADEVLARPVEDQALMALIRSTMRQRAMAPGPAAELTGFGLAEPAAGFERPARIALVTARPDTALRLRREIAALSPHQVAAMTPEEALLRAAGPEAAAPEAFVIEADLGQPGGGLRLMSELQSRQATCHAAFVILLPEGSGTPAAMAYDLGAQGLMSAAAPGAEAALRLTRLIARKRADDRRRASVQDGLRLAMIDPLTGLHNRRYAAARLAAIAEGAAAGAAAGGAAGFAVMVMDLDRFKQVNDRWGHAAGDAVLVEVAARLGGALRAGDLLARIGGEEFLAALPRISLPEAEAVAGRLRQAVEERPILLPTGQAVSVTVSIGLAHAAAAPADDRAGHMREVVEHADRALLQSKSAGRNQVTVFPSAA